MRLTCPTCGAEYEIADAMVPAAGRHVQCTACHARWFVRRVAARQESEDEIMQRLESRSHLRAVPTPARTPAPEATPAEPTPTPEAAAAPSPTKPSPTKPSPAKLSPAKPSPASASPPEAPRGEPAAPAAAPGPAAAIPPDPPTLPASAPTPRAVPAKPAERPMLAGDSLALRPAPRLTLGAEPKASPARPATPSRFGRGLLLALGLFGLALSAYVWRADLATRLPAAAPALDAYGRAVDDLRLELDRQIDRQIDRLPD